jgi:Concanavalin A-like lectin/glucanases superfamily/Curli production assembly/transport component CsgG
MRHRFLKTAAITLNLFFALSNLRANEPDKADFVRVLNKSGKSYVGEYVKEDEVTIVLRDLDTGKADEFIKEKLAKVERPLGEAEAARYIGLPKLMAWKISQLAKTTPVVGKIAKIIPSVIYLNIGEASSVAPGQELTVYRSAEDVIDPDTKKVLTHERQKLAKLQVVEVGKAYSKAKMLGELEISLTVGDEVELAADKLLVAVLPIKGESGDEDVLTEQLTTTLTNKGIPVVERALLDKVLTELVIQNSALFDEKTAQRIGKQLGATAVLTGQIVGRGEAHVRLIQITSGRILLAASQKLPTTGFTTSGSAHVSRQAGTLQEAPLKQPNSRGTRLPQGTVAAFDFERRSTTRRDSKLMLKDLSNRGGDGEVVSAKFAPGVHGTAISFSGDGYVQFPDSALPKGDSPRSILFWMRIEKVAGDTVPFAFGSLHPDDATYVVFYDDDRKNPWKPEKLYVGNFGGRNMQAGDSIIADGKWRHIALVYDGNGTVTTYVDDRLDHNFGKRYRTTPSGNAVIGNNLDHGAPLHGAIDDFIVLDRAVSADEINSIKQTNFANK